MVASKDINLVDLKGKIEVVWMDVKKECSMVAPKVEKMDLSEVSMLVLPMAAHSAEN